MQRGFYTAASGILTQQRVLDVLTNNMANLRTPGYRAGRVVTNTFDQELLTRIEGRNSGYIGQGSIMRRVDEVLTKFDPSTLQQTERPYDMALNGVGYFNIQTEDGQQYLTRYGSFDIDEQNQLVLPGQGLVMGENGPIVLTTSDFTVDSDGSIYDARGQLVDKLLLTVPPEDTLIERAENGLFYTEDMAANVVVDAADIEVVQSWLEINNVDINQEYSLVMEAQRAFQSCSTALQIIDKIDQKAASQIAALG